MRPRPLGFRIGAAAEVDLCDLLAQQRDETLFGAIHVRLRIGDEIDVDRVYTDMAVLAVTADGLVLREIAEGLLIDDVVSATEAPLHIPETDLPTF